MFLIGTFKFISERQKRVVEEITCYKNSDDPLNEERFRKQRNEERSHAEGN